jgi:hypothetical protein
MRKCSLQISKPFLQISKLLIKIRPLICFLLNLYYLCTQRYDAKDGSVIQIMCLRLVDDGGDGFTGSRLS